MELGLGKLFIGGISWDTDEDRLKEYFGNYGELVEALIMRDRATGRARGFGFIVFADPTVAERVIMDKHMIDGRTVEAKKAVPRDDQHILSRNTTSIQGSPGPGRTKKIFVGGLASTVTDGDFKKYFDQFGLITDVVMMYDHNTQRPRGFGFITYDSEEAVDRVLHKTFHELDGKMVEVKRAVPKEISPGPNRSPLLGYNYGLNRASNFLNSYAQGFNMSSMGGPFRMDGRFNPIASSRSGFPPYGTTGYGVGMNMEPRLSPGYGGSSNFSSSLGYGHMLSPYHSGNSNRYSTPIGYGTSNGRNDYVLSSTGRNVWGNVRLNNATNPASLGDFSDSGSGNFGASFGNNGVNWGPSPASGQSGGNSSGYINGSIIYGSEESNYGLGGRAYGRNSVTVEDPASSFVSSTRGYEGSYGDLYHSGSVYDDSIWPSTTPDLDGSASYGYGLGNATSDVAAKSSEGYIGTYGVTSRQGNRGIAA